MHLIGNQANPSEIRQPGPGRQKPPVSQLTRSLKPLRPSCLISGQVPQAVIDRFEGQRSIKLVKLIGQSKTLIEQFECFWFDGMPKLMLIKRSYNRQRDIAISPQVEKRIF